LSQSVAKRDDQLKLLLQHSNVVTKVLADRNQQLIKLMKDGNTVFQAVQARRALIHQLLVSTQQLSAQITALVRENRRDLAPTLQKVNAVLAVLLKNQNALDGTIRNLAPFVRVFTNTLGTGPWFDSYVQNLVPVPEIPLPSAPIPGLPPILGGGG
jgi:phospholipid/cholesterol/gamma-HCH transport system substrate-binding protein